MSSSMNRPNFPKVSMWWKRNDMRDIWWVASQAGVGKWSTSCTVMTQGCPSSYTSSQLRYYKKVNFYEISNGLLLVLATQCPFSWSFSQRVFIFLLIVLSCKNESSGSQSSVSPDQMKSIKNHKISLGIPIALQLKQPLLLPDNGCTNYEYNPLFQLWASNVFEMSCWYMRSENSTREPIQMVLLSTCKPWFSELKMLYSY